MKHLVFLMLMVTSIKVPLFAQEEVIDRSPKPYSLTQLYDVNSGINTPYARFEFDFDAHNRMFIDLDHLEQLDSLPNLDSLFRAVWDDLQEISDSLDDPLVSRWVHCTVGPSA